MGNEAPRGTSENTPRLGFEARVLLHVWNRQILRRADVSKWADRCLRRDDIESGDLCALLDLSAPPPNGSDDVRRHLEALASPDSREARRALVGVVGRLYEADALSMSEVTRVLYELKYESCGDEYPEEFWKYWDEWDLAKEGLMGNPAGVRKRVEAVLEGFLEYAEWFQPAS
jgi:hypothetical protein